MILLFYIAQLLILRIWGEEGIEIAMPYAIWNGIIWAVIYLDNILNEIKEIKKKVKK